MRHVCTRSIDELAGNVASKDDRISIARCSVTAPTSEPWLVLDYDEWICVLKGVVHLRHADGVLVVNAGDTAYVKRGERFKPEFPVPDTEYVPVCMPAFRPDRCKREDDPQGDIPQKLAALHNQKVEKAETLYHMCVRSIWEEAKKAKTAYYPPTFEVDGFFTHATAVPARLIETANHFYQSVEGDWVCLVLSRSKLAAAGIYVKDEAALPVGDTAVGSDWNTWVCPHIYGGIPPSVVTGELDMTRDGGKFTGIVGL